MQLTQADVRPSEVSGTAWYKLVAQPYVKKVGRLGVTVRACRRCPALPGR